MAEEAFGPVFEIHGGGLDLVFPHHENELAQSRALGHEFARIWTHNGMLEFGGEKMSKSLGNDVSIRNVLDTWGREVAAALLHDRPLAQADRLHRRDARAGEGAGRRVPQRLRARRPRPAPASGSAFEAALDDDFNTPEALALMHDWRRRERARAAAPGLDVFGLGSLAERDDAPAEVVAARRGSGSGARPRKDFAEADRLRDEIAAARLGGARRRRRLPSSSRDVTREQVYGRRPVREALRGRPRGARALGDRARGQGRGLAARARAAARPGEARARPDRGGGHARPPGRARVVRAVPLRRRLRARRGRAAAARVPRPGQRPAQPRRGLPQRRGRGRDRRRRAGARLGARDAGRLPRVGRRGRAPAGRGRDEPRPLPRGDQGRRPLGRRRRRASRARRCGRPTSPAGSRSSSARRARGCGRSSAGRATSQVSIPQLGQRRVAERQRRGGGAPLRGAAAARMAEPTLYLFDGFNLLHAGGFDSTGRAARPARELGRGEGRARRARLRRARRRRGARPARGALGARTPTR